MITMVNGNEVSIPMESDGSIDTDTLREVAGISKNRPLVLQLPNGRNEIINPGEKRIVNPGSHIRDILFHERGFQKCREKKNT